MCPCSQSRCRTLQAEVYRVPEVGVEGHLEEQEAEGQRTVGLVVTPEDIRVGSCDKVVRHLCRRLSKEASVLVPKCPSLQWEMVHSPPSMQRGYRGAGTMWRPLRHLETPFLDSLSCLPLQQPSWLDLLPLCLSGLLSASVVGTVQVQPGPKQKSSLRYTFQSSSGGSLRYTFQSSSGGGLYLETMISRKKIPGLVGF